MNSIIEKYTRALEMYRDDGISVPVLPSDLRLMLDEIERLRERQVCENGRPYVCHELATARSRLKDAAGDAVRYRWLVNCNDAGVWSFLAGMDDDQIDEAIDKWIEDDSESNGEL